jgi:uncharacterized membrane protein YdjX (TVP38/TMEM64 family)
VSAGAPARAAARRSPATRRLRWLAAAVWVALVATYAGAVLRSGLGPAEVALSVLRFLQDHPLGPLAYVVAYLLRPLLLFSATVLTIGAGVIFGPVVGFAVVVIGANGGALLAYTLGAYLGADLAGRALGHPRLRGAARRLRANAFEAVVTLRLLFVPYDAVNYLAGALRLSLPAFAVGTLVGSLPGTLTFLLLGAGLGDLAALDPDVRPGVDARLLAASAVVLVTTLTLSRLRRARLGDSGRDAP